MSQKERLIKGKSFIFLIFLLIVAYGYFRLDFGKFDYQPFDVLYLLPPQFWAYILAVCVTLILYIRLSNYNPLVILLATASVLFLFPLHNLPSSFGHDFPNVLYYVRGIIQNGVVDLQMGSYYEFPGSFVLVSVLGIVTNCTGTTPLIFLITGLGFLMNLFITVILLLLGRSVLPKYEYLPSIIYLLGNFSHTGSYLYLSPQLFCLALWPFLLLMIFMKHSRALYLNIILIGSVIIISHILTSYLVLASLLGVLVIEKFFTRRYPRLHFSLGIFLSFGILWFGWLIFNAIINLKHSIVPYLLSVLTLSAEKYVAYSGFPPTKYGLGIIFWAYREGFHAFVLTFMIYGIYRIMISLRKRRNPANLLCVLGILLALAGAAISVMFSSDRMILFGYAPSAILATYGILQNRYRRRLTYILLVLIVFSFAARFPCTYSSFSHSWEVSGAVFIGKHALGRVIGTDTHTMYLINYHTYDINNLYASYESRRELSIAVIDLPDRCTRVSTLFEGEILVRSFNQQVTSYYASGISPNFWRKLDEELQKNLYLNEIYDNDYVQVYEEKL